QRDRHLVQRVDHAGLEGGGRLARRAAAGVAWAAAASVVVVKPVTAGAGVFRQLHAGRITGAEPFRSPCGNRRPLAVGCCPYFLFSSLLAQSANGQRSTGNERTTPTKRRATSR